MFAGYKPLQVGGGLEWSTRRSIAGSRLLLKPLPQVYITQECIGEIKNNPQVYITQECIGEIERKP